MRSVADMSRQELEQTLADEIASARAEARPISRLTLSRSLQSKFPINPHEAEKVVDRYCDEKAPGVPTYLSSEFGTPYLKVLAIINVAIGLGLSVTALVTMTRGAGYLIWLILALVFLGGAALCWVKSVRTESPKVATRMPAQMPRVNSQPSESVETVSTGSLQSRS